jgi:hypothetical protein
MIRLCSHCCRRFTPQDFVKEESKGMEAERKALGLEGVRFLYYHCAVCGYVDIFLDTYPRAGESDAAFQARKRELEAVVSQVHADGAEAVLVEVLPRRFWCEEAPATLL